MMTGRMRFKRGQCEGMDSIEIIGPFDTNDPRIDEAVRDIVDEGKTGMVFDFSQTAYVTSPGVAVMIKAIKRFELIKGSVYVYGATQDIRNFLSLSRIEGFLKFMG